MKSMDQIKLALMKDLKERFETNPSLSSLSNFVLDELTKIEYAIQEIVQRLEEKDQ